MSIFVLLCAVSRGNSGPSCVHIVPMTAAHTNIPTIELNPESHVSFTAGRLTKSSLMIEWEYGQDVLQIPSLSAKVAVRIA